jgi:hypothetical protein
MNVQLHSQKGHTGIIAVFAILLSGLLLNAATNSSIELNQLSQQVLFKEGLEKVSETALSVLSEPKACAGMLATLGALNQPLQNGGTFSKPFELKFYNEQGQMVGNKTLTDAILIGSERTMQTKFVMGQPVASATNTLRVELRIEASHKGFKFNTSKIQIPLYIELNNDTKSVIGCRATMYTDSGGFLEDDLCKTFGSGTNYSLANKKCE